MAHVETAVEHIENVEHVEHAAGGFAALAADPSFWIAVSVALFALLFIRYIMPHITKGLDDRSSKIREQLEQASRLREQAQELLASYKAEQEARTREAELIVATARADAEAMREQAAAELAHSIERRKQQAVEKIARAEVEAIAEVRARMVELATAATMEIVREQLESSKEDPAIGRAIKAIEQQIH